MTHPDIKSCRTADRRPISRLPAPKTPRIGFSRPFDAIAMRKTAPHAALRDPKLRAPIFHTGSGGFGMAANKTTCE
jgi:hypothetical protein